MGGRFDVRPLLHGLSIGLRRRRVEGDEAPDTWARVILVVGPSTVGVLAFIFGPFEKADQLIAGFALLIGALIAAFVQLAAWRDRLAERNFKVDQIRIRSLDEAVAHVLVSIVVTIVGTAVLVVLANVPDIAYPQLWLTIAMKALSLLGGIAFTYVALSLLIVVNLLWDAYTATDVEP